MLTAKEIALNWLLFSLQLTAIIVLFILLLTLIRYLRIFRKRARALRDLRRIARECGYRFQKTGPCYRSLFRNYAKPYVILESDDIRYAIRFLPTLRKNRIVQIRSPQIYRINRQFGYILPSRNARMLAVAQIFRPDSIGDELLSMTHKEMHEFQRGDKIMPQLWLPESEGGVREIVILHPAPMRAVQVHEGRERQIIGGETINGIGYYDMFGFCSMLKRKI